LTAKQPLAAFFVHGVPVSQGSKELVRTMSGGRMITRMIESTDKGAKRRLETWRNAIGWAAKVRYRGKPVSGPLIVELHFRLVRPPSSSRLEPDIKPDLSKLIRAVEDALTGILWIDDCQIVQLDATKGYAKETGVGVAVQQLDMRDPVEAWDEWARENGITETT